MSDACSIGMGCECEFRPQCTIVHVVGSGRFYYVYYRSRLGHERLDEVWAHVQKLV